jgi:hypothetical protein
MQPDKKAPEDDSRHEYIPGRQEKSTLGGAYNTGVTSEDQEEKEEIEKKGSLAVLKPREDSSKNDNSSGQ